MVKIKLKFYLLGGLGADFRIWTHWPKKKGHKLRHCGLLAVLNTLLALSYPGGKYYDKKSCFLNICFVKFLICPYWAKNLTVLTVWLSMLFTIFTISLDFQNMYIFFKTFFVRTFYHAVCNIFNIRDFKFQIIKLQLLKCISFEEQLLHFQNFFLCNTMSSYLYKVWEDKKTE